jgi:hypothetical protein
MRLASVLLVVTLIAPSITSVVCDFTCVQHDHHSADAESPQSCHEQGSSIDGPAVASGAAGSCHEQAENLTTTAADLRVLKATPVVVHFQSALAEYPQQIRRPAPGKHLGPPEIVRQTTPLRI